MVGEWQRREVSDLLNEGKLIIGDGYRAKNEELTSSGLPFARAGNINNGFRFEDADHFPEQNLARVGNKVSQPGDVVFTSKGTVGRFALVRPETKRFVYSPQLCFWRSLDCEKIDPRFLYYWMCGHEFFVQFKGVSGQTDMAEYVSLTDQRRMHITLPSIYEQRAIAHILGTLDDKIELNRCMNETLEAMARVLFKSWFVDFDPVRAKMEGRDTGLPKEIADLFPDSFEESEMGEIPRGWKKLPLYETAKFINGAAFKSEDFCATGEGLPVVKIAELKDGISTQTKWSQRQAGPEQLINTKDLLYSWSGSPDTSLDAFLWTKGPGLLNQHIFKVVAPTTTQKRFVYYLLKFLRPILVETARNKQTTGLGHVTVADMKRLLVCWPTEEILAAFDRKIAPIFDRAFANSIEVQALAALRDTILPKLISGELHMSNVGSIALESA